MSAPGKAWTGRKRCKPSITETLYWNPAGTQSRPTKLGQQSEASLASDGATRQAKRRQRVTRPCDGAPKEPSWEPTWFIQRKAAPKRRIGLAWRSHRGRRAGHGHEGFPRNLGDPAVSTGRTGAGRPVEQTPGPWGRRLSPRERRAGRRVVPRDEGDRRSAGQAAGSRSGP